MEDFKKFSLYQQTKAKYGDTTTNDRDNLEKAVTNYDYKTTVPLGSSVTTTTPRVVGEGLAFNNNSKWIMFPIDIDGIPIHLGDEVYPAHLSPSYHFTVKELTFIEDGWEVEDYEPRYLRHWEVPTVSSLLREFMADLNSKNWSNSEMNSLINDYEKRIKEAVKYEQEND
jgi:hypothetical protein